MASDVKFILLNAEEEFATELRALLLQYHGAKIVAEMDEPAMLAQAVSQFAVDIVIANLDPSPDAVLPLLGEVAAAHKSTAIFAASTSTDGPLILRTIRAGMREFLTRPIDPHTLGEAIERVAVQKVDTVSNGKLITVLGGSGGVGATFVASNLAVELAALSTGGVTVVDLDYRFGQVATFLDINPTFSIADLCGSPEHLEPSVVTRALTTHSKGLHVLSRPSTFVEADAITGAACMSVFSTLMQMNEYTIADGPVRTDIGATSILSLSDVNLLVVQQLVPCVRNATRIIEGLRAGGYNLGRTKLICNRVGRESGHLTVENVAETLGLDVFATIPDDWATVSMAINIGEPLYTHSPKSKVRVALQEIAQRLHTPPAETDDKDAKKRGLIGRIFAAS